MAKLSHHLRQTQCERDPNSLGGGSSSSSSSIDDGRHCRCCRLTSLRRCVTFVNVVVVVFIPFRCTVICRVAVSFKRVWHIDAQHAQPHANIMRMEYEKYIRRKTTATTTTTTYRRTPNPGCTSSAFFLCVVDSAWIYSDIAVSCILRGNVSEILKIQRNYAAFFRGINFVHHSAMLAHSEFIESSGLRP